MTLQPSQPGKRPNGREVNGMATLTRSVMIAAPVEDVFNFVLDIGKFWSRFGGVAVREVDVQPEGVGTSATIYSHLLAIHMPGEGRVHGRGPE